jgi:hypothetical protein
LAVFEISLVRDLGPFAGETFLVSVTFTVTFGVNIDLDSGEILFWGDVGVVGTIWSENIRGNALFDADG